MKKHLATLIYAILAGICIGLGGTVFLRVKDLFPGAIIPAALLFGIGLFAICTRGYNLFTGRACYLFDHNISYLGTLGIIWLGNFIGTGLVAFVQQFTSLCGTESGLNVTAQALVEAKMASGLGNVFLLACLCNIFIYLAVNGFAKNPHQGGKYLVIFLGVSCFILAGTEHSIADMYYWAVSGVLVQSPLKSLVYLVTISLGNVVGGVFFPLMEKAQERLAE